jgi:hypothetical protein
MKPDATIQQFIEETRALTTQINEFSEHWHDLDNRGIIVQSLPISQKNQLVKAVTMFEEACKHMMEKP